MAAVPPTEAELVDGVPVTKALRSLLDVAGAGGVPAGDLCNSFREATRTGKITRSEIAEAESNSARRDLLRKLEGRKR